MTIIDTINKDYEYAYKSGEAQRVSVIRMIKAAIEKVEKPRQNPSDKNHGKPLTDDDVIMVIRKFVSEVKDSLGFAEKAKRQDLIDKYTEDINIAMAYLPEEWSDKQIAVHVALIMSELQSSEFKKVMPVAAQRLKGKASGALISEVVRSLANG